MKNKLVHCSHRDVPLYINDDSEILILGSFPSVKSRENNFYYAHPSNRFFPLLSEVFNEPKLNSLDEKKFFLKRHKIALYDVIEECDICGSDDKSITNVIPSDINSIINNHNIKIIYTTGKKAYELFCLYNKNINIPVISLPSSSSASFKSFNELLDKYKIIKQNIDK